MNIVNVGYESTNYYVLADTRPRLLLDVGFPGTLPKLEHQCKRAGVVFGEIKHLLTTHFHPDHAGLAQELKQRGVKLIVLDLQMDAVPILKTYMKSEQHYVEIDLTDNQNIILKLDDSRAFLSGLGIQGEIISTPGHSDDSVTLILDEGAAFTGDLPHPMIVDESMETVNTSWQKIRAHNVKKIYPGHGPVWPLYP